MEIKRRITVHDIDREEYIKWQQNLNQKILMSLCRTCLDPVSREIVDRYITHQQTFKFIGRVMGLHEKTVSYKYHRAIKRLRRSYEGK